MTKQTKHLPLHKYLGGLKKINSWGGSSESKINGCEQKTNGSSKVSFSSKIIQTNVMFNNIVSKPITKFTIKMSNKNVPQDRVIPNRGVLTGILIFF